MTNSDTGQDDEPFIILDFLGDRLDPAPLVALIPMQGRKPVRKGDPLGRATPEGSVPRAKTGYCGFSTGRHIRSADPNDHLLFLLDVLAPRIAQIRDIIAAQDLTWKAILFQAEMGKSTLPPLDPILLQRVQELGLPLRPKGAEP